MSTRSRSVAACTVALLLTGGLLVSCDRGPQESSEPPPPAAVVDGGAGTLRFGLAAAPRSLDPFQGVPDASTLQVLRALFDSLLVIDEHSQLRPGLADAVVPNDDFTSFRITARPGVSFSDGSPVDAGAIAASLDRARTTSDLAAFLSGIASITVEGTGDDAEVVVTMGEPWASFPYQLAGRVGMVVAPSMTAAADPGRQPVGAGSYVLRDWTGEQLLLERNERYWQAGRPLLAAIELPIVPDPSVRVTRLAEGSLDVSTVLEAQQMARVHSGTEGLQVLSDPSDETAEWVVVLNTDGVPFADLMAREAVAFSIDRDAIVARVFAGEYRPSKGPYSEGSRFFGDARWPILDTGHANDLAKQYADANGAPLQFELVVGPDEVSTQLGRLLQSQVATVGIATDLVVAETPEQLDAIRDAGDFDALLEPLFDGAHPDEDDWLLAATPEDAERPNPSRYGSETMSEALQAARASDDFTVQAEAYQSVLAELATQLPYLFLVHGQGLIVAGPDVRGLATWSTPDGFPGVRQTQLTVSLGDVWIEPDATPGTTPGRAPDGTAGPPGS